MAFRRDWENEIKGLDNDSAQEMYLSLDSLLKWDFFQKAYYDFGLSTVKTILRQRLKDDADLKD